MQWQVLRILPPDRQWYMLHIVVTINLNISLDRSLKDEMVALTARNRNKGMLIKTTLIAAQAWMYQV